MWLLAFLLFYSMISFVVNICLLVFMREYIKHHHQGYLSISIMMSPLSRRKLAQKWLVVTETTISIILTCTAAWKNRRWSAAMQVVASCQTPVTSQKCFHTDAPACLEFEVYSPEWCDISNMISLKIKADTTFSLTLAFKYCWVVHS